MEDQLQFYENRHFWLKYIFQDLRAQKIPSFTICKKCCIFTICDKKNVLYSKLRRVTSLKRPWQGVALLTPSRVAYGQNYLPKIVYRLYFWQAVQRNSGLWAVSTDCRRPPETFWPDMKLAQRRFLLKLKKIYVIVSMLIYNKTHLFSNLRCFWHWEILWVGKWPLFCYFPSHCCEKLGFLLCKGKIMEVTTFTTYATYYSNQKHLH